MMTESASGTDAGLAWESLVRGSLDCGEHERIRKHYWIIAGGTR